MIGAVEVPALVGDETETAREVAEAAVAYTTGEETEVAYSRRTALAKRRKLMEDWTTYSSSAYQHTFAAV